MIHQLGAALTALKTQQNLLTSILASTLIPRGNSPAPDSFNERYHSNNSTRNYASRGFGTIPQSRASSISLATSEDTDDYYEATSAMGEFVFQDDEDDDGSDEEEGYKNRDDVIDDDQYPDADEYVEVVEPSLDQIPEGEVAMLRKSTIVAPVSRRAQLPSPVSGDEFSMLSMLRKNVGKVRTHLLLSVYKYMDVNIITTGSVDHLVPSDFQRASLSAPAYRRRA